MKFALPLAGALAAVGLVAATPALQDHTERLHRHLLHQRHEHDAADHFEKLAEHLGLTAAQRASLAVAIRANLEPLGTSFQTFAYAYAAQASTIHAATYDEEAIRLAAAKVGSAQEELAVAMARLARDVHAELTNEQLEKLGALHGHDVLQKLREHVHALLTSAKAWSERQ